MAKAKTDSLIPIERVASRIYLIRGMKVMFDFDLAELYTVETKALNQAVSRNLERFPPDFMFTLTHQEVTTLRSQFVTSNWGGRRYLPRVFTQEGVAMLSGILHGKRAVEVNVSIMRAFVRLLTFIPFDAFANWRDTKWKRRGAAYESLKQSLAARLQAALEQHEPAVAGKIDYAELSTPLTTRHFMNYQRGEIYGIGSTPARYRMRALGARTPIRNLYLTGQDVTSLGVVGALFGGAVSASAVLGKNLMSKLAKPFVSKSRV
jgi:hypothetical protein